MANVDQLTVAQAREILRQLGVVQSAIDAAERKLGHHNDQSLVGGALIYSLSTGSAQHSQRIKDRAEQVAAEVLGKASKVGVAQNLGVYGQIVGQNNARQLVGTELGGAIDALVRRGISTDNIRNAYQQAQKAAAGRPGIAPNAATNVDFSVFNQALTGLGENVTVIGSADTFIHPAPTQHGATGTWEPTPGTPAQPQQAQAAGDPFAGKTKAQVKAIQKQLGVAQDGIAGPITRAAYDRANGTTSASAPRAGGGGGGGGRAGGGGGTTVAPPSQPATAAMSDDQIINYVRQNYGADAAYLDANPGLRSIFIDAVRNHPGDQAYLENQVRNTDWFKSTSESQRLWDAKLRLDPASAANDVTGKAAEISAYAKAQGVNLAADRVNQLATDSLRNGWAPTQTQQAVLHEFNYTKGAAFGAAAGTEAQVNQMVSDYLVPMSDSTKATWINRIVQGDDTVDGLRSTLVGQAESLYPGLKPALDAGHTVRTFADPYAQIASKELEIPADQVDFFNPRYQRALSQIDPKTGERTAMNLSDWTNYLRALPEWKSTSGAKAMTSDLIQQIGQTFGKSAA